MSQKSHGHICPKKIFLYCFPITAITNFHKLSGLKNPHVLETRSPKWVLVG